MKHPSPVSYTHSPVPPLPQHTRSLVSSALSLLILITCGIQAELDSLHLIDFPRRCKKEEGADWGWHGCALSLPCSGSALAAGHSAPSHPLPRLTWGSGRQTAARHPQTQQHLLPPLHTLSAGGQGELSSYCNPPPPADFPKEEGSGVLWGDSKWSEQSGKSGHLHCSPFPCLQ